ncbi:MAG: NAD(P)-binding domain-containing protein [Spartobacteria bacterium]
MARSKNKNVGVIGLGIIGSRVAGALRDRGLQAFVWNRTPRPEQNFVGSPTEVAELCDVVQIFVADDQALLETVRQLSPALNAQHIVTAHCTVAPESMRAAAEVVQRRGARFLEAPFTGSKVAAGKGELVYYISGDDAALKQARTILEASSKDIIYIGDKIGEASIIKVATNIVTAATAQVTAEALALVRKAGISAELFSRAMKSNASNSATVEMKVPLIIAGDFEPHFSVKHMLKDVRIGLKLAERNGLDLPVTEASGDMLLAEMKKGRGDADYSSVAQKYFPAQAREATPEPERPAKPEKPVKTEEPFEPVKLHKPEPPASEKAVEAVKEEQFKVEEPKAEGPVASVEAPEPMEELAPVVEAPETPAPITASVGRTEAVQPPSEVKESPAGKQPVGEPKTAQPNWDEDEAEEEDVPGGVNLSGGMRGWLSRFLSGKS